MFELGSKTQWSKLFCWLFVPHMSSKDNEAFQISFWNTKKQSLRVKNFSCVYIGLSEYLLDIQKVKSSNSGT